MPGESYEFKKDLKYNTNVPAPKNPIIYYILKMSYRESIFFQQTQVRKKALNGEPSKSLTANCVRLRWQEL